MDKKEASFILANIDRRVCDDELNEALDMAIKALEQEPKTDTWSIKDVANTFKKHGLIVEQEPSGNAIDRKLVCAFIDGLISDDGEREKGLEYIRNMPPVNPQPCEEAISRAEAVRVASGYCHPANVAKELAKLPSVNPQPCEDAISRENAIIRISWDFPTLEISKVKESLDKLPPVTPQPKTGHWIDDNENEIDAQYGIHLYKCSECDEYASAFVGGTEDWWDIEKPNYCPNCGSRMVEPQESEDKE